jgi:CAAX protease family protein
MNEFADFVRKVFVNNEAELRSGWRVLAFTILYAVTATLISGLLSTLVLLIPSLGFLTARPDLSGPVNGLDLVLLIFFQMLSLIAIVIATAISTLLLERRSVGSVGFKAHRGWMRDAAFGVFLGSATLSFTIALIKLAGAVRFETRGLGRASEFLPSAFAIVFFFMIAAAVEELMFRGFPFQALVHNIGPGWAIGISAAFFGLAHLANRGATVMSTINTALAGVWLGYAYLKTRSLWFATALHFSWNWMMAFVFGLPVSGFTTFAGRTVLYGIPGLPEWISGSNYGPEGGAAATVAILLSTLVLFKTGMLATTEEMLEALKHGGTRTDRTSLGAYLKRDADEPSSQTSDSREATE